MKVFKVMVEVSEIAETTMKEDIKMDCHEEVDNQDGKIIKIQRLVGFVVMTVYAMLNGWAWAALMYTS